MAGFEESLYKSAHRIADRATAAVAALPPTTDPLVLYAQYTGLITAARDLSHEAPTTSAALEWRKLARGLELMQRVVCNGINNRGGAFAEGAFGGGDL